ncbi:hypothetical protein [Caulobacter segnis]
MSGNFRRRRCDCGSGKRFNSCCEGKQAFAQVVTFEVDEDTIVTDLVLSPDGRLQMLGPSEPIASRSIEAMTMRPRPGKPPKILTRTPAEQSFSINLWDHIGQYDALFCIDTNTQTVEGRTVSVAAAFQISDDEGGLSPEGLMARPLGVFEFHGVTQKQENLAWGLFMQSVLKGQDHRNGRRYALITDSDQGAHQGYNDRKAPFFADRVLPDAFTLLYASDQGQSFLNDTIRKCDAQSRNVFRAYRDGVLTLADAPPAPPGLGAFTHCRFWWLAPRPGTVRLAALRFPPPKPASST